MGDTRILIVDDDRVLRSVLGSALEEAGYGCAVAANADEARERLAEGGVAAVLCDVMMPGETGFSLVAFIRREHPDVPILVMTGIADAALTQRTMELGVVGCLRKPFEPDQMLAELRGALAEA